MKQLDHLLIVEADPALTPSLPVLSSVLTPFSKHPVGVQTPEDLMRNGEGPIPALAFFYGNLQTAAHLHRFTEVRKALPYSMLIIVSEEQDEERCLQAIEAGADDSVLTGDLTPSYLRKTVLRAQRRTQAEKERVQSREQLLACIQNTPNVAVQWYNSRSEVLFWNHASERIFGWTAEEAVGRTIDELIAVPENQYFWRNKIRHLSETRSAYGPQEWNFRYRNGSQGCCISTLSPLPSFDNEPWFVCIDVEITDRRNMEKELQQSEERYHKLFNRASDAIFINDLRGRFLNMNDKACELTGHSRQALLQMTLTEFYSPEELRRRPIMWPELLRGERTRIERELRHANGTVFPIEVTAQMFTDDCVMAIVRDVSEHRKAIEAVEESRRQLDLIYNSTSDVIFLLRVEEGPRFRFASINKAFCTVTGLQEEAVVERTVDEVIPEPSLTTVLAKYNEAIRTGLSVSWEEVTPFPNGVKNGVVSITPVFDRNGRCTQLVGTVHDITARKTAEEAVALSEKKYRSLIEQQADSIALFDKEGKILDVNSSATALLQYSREEFQHLRLTDVLLPEDLQKQPIDFAQLATGISTIKQRKMKRRDGSLVETEVHAKQLVDGLFLASVRDLTERIETQRQLQKESELSDSIINSLPGLFYLYQPDVGYLRWNRQLEQSSGYSAAEIKTMSPLDFFAEDEKPLVEAAIQKVFTNGDNSIEANLRTKDGRKIPYYFTGRYIAYNGRPSFLGTAINLSEVNELKERLSKQKITEQKKIMQAMLEAEEKEKNKLGLELHDNVNQILSVVRMYLTILNSPEQLEEITLDKAIQLLNSAIQEIRQLSHSLAISYKFETGLAGSLQEMVDAVALARDFTIDLRLAPGVDKHTTAQQKLALYRMVQEQLNNIIKHAGATAVNIEIDVTQTQVRLTVVDNGRGFHPAKAGGGLRLNNIINRAEALEGKAAVYSWPGKGCRLEVELPLATEQWATNDGQ